MFSYRTILKQAFSLSWKNKYLWFFGLFASLTIAGGSIESQFITERFGQGVVSSSYHGLENLLGVVGFFKLIYLGLIDIFSQDIVTILQSLTIIILILTFVALFVWLAISSQAAIVNAVSKIIPAKKKKSILSLRDYLTASNEHFWPVLGFNILIRFLISIAFFISSLPLLFMVISDSYIFVILYTVLFVVFVPIALSLSLIIKYAISYQVLENKSFIVSLEKGYALFKKNWLISLEVALLLFLITLFSSLAVLIILAITVFPLLVTGLLFSLTWLIVLMIFIALIVIILFGSLMTTFQISSWTNLYLHLQADKGLSKLERIFQKK